MTGIAFEPVADPATERNFRKINSALGLLAELPVFILDAGSPNGTITASPPAICFVRAGGAAATFWVKESGSSTNTGWSPK